MTDLSPRAKDLLAQFRRADALDPGAHERMARGLFDKLARGESALAGIDATPPALPDVAWTAKLLGSTAAKLSAGLLVVAAGVTTLTLATIPAAPEPQAPPSQPMAAAPAPESPPDVVAPALLPVIEPPPAPPAAAAPAKPPRPRRARRARAPDAPSAVSEAAPAIEVAPPAEPLPPAPDPEPSSPHRVTSPLDSELGLLRRAYLELNANRPERAIEALDEHAYRFPRGELLDAREVARMLALCGLDRELEARALAKKFLKAHPRSPFAGRVRALCPVSLPKTSP